MPGNSQESPTEALVVGVVLKEFIEQIKSLTGLDKLRREKLEQATSARRVRLRHTGIVHAGSRIFGRDYPGYSCGRRSASSTASGLAAAWLLSAAIAIAAAFAFSLPLSFSLPLAFTLTFACWRHDPKPDDESVQ